MRLGIAAIFLFFNSLSWASACPEFQKIWSSCQKNSDCAATGGVCFEKAAVALKYKVEFDQHVRCLQPIVDCNPTAQNQIVVGTACVKSSCQLKYKK